MRRIHMKQAREIIRLYHDTGLNQREIATMTGCSAGKVNGVLAKVKEHGLSYPVGMTDDELSGVLFPPKDGVRVCVEPDLEHIHREMQKKGVTLQTLWEEYKQANPGGLMYTQFCKRYREFRKQNNVYMRKVYKAGDQGHFDWAGKTMSYSDESGEHKVYLFVANLPASSYIYTEPFRDMKLHSWIDGHVHAFEYYGGTPRVAVTDNAPTAVSKHDNYDPGLNKSYADMGRHYGVCLLPTKAYSPTWKSPVEKGVQIVERQIIAKLRNRQFTSFEEICIAVAAELEVINTKPFQKMPTNRRELFEEIERPLLRPLPPTRYEYAEWKIAKVSNDYHIQHGKKGDVFFYSVPYQYAHKEVEVRVGSRMIEIYYQHERIAVHRRRYHGYDRYVTLAEHMPAKHRAVAEWSPERFKSWAKKIGPETRRFIESLLDSREFPEQAFRTCSGILRLAKDVSAEQMELACAAAIEQNIYTYKSFKILLSNRNEANAITHSNVRGSEYYGGDTNAR